MALGRFVNSILNGAAAPADHVVQSDENGVPHGGATTDGAGRALSPEEVEVAQTARALDALRATVRRAGADLPPLLSSQLRQIDDLLRVVIATIAEQGASTEQRVLLAAMVTDYLPSPLRAFLALPASDRTEQSRGTLIFARQLELLEETIRDLLNQVRIGAIAELSTHGRFLADKFQTPDEGLVLGGR